MQWAPTILLQLTSASRSFLCGPGDQSQSALDDWPMARYFLWFCYSAVLSGVVRGSLNCPYCLIITSNGVICAAKCTCSSILLHITRDYLTWKKSELKLKDIGHSICKQMSTQVLEHIFASSWSSHEKLGVVQITFGVINNIFHVKTKSKCMRTALYVLTQQSQLFSTLRFLQSLVVLCKKKRNLFLSRVGFSSFHVCFESA